MIYKTHYKSPIGDLLLASKDNKLIGLWIEGQKYYMSNFLEEMKKNDTDKTLVKAKKWLDRYFNKEKPNIKELEMIYNYI